MKRICLLFAVLLTINIFASDIAVVSMAVGDEYQKSVKLGIENKQKYCELHGYDFICARESFDSSRPIPWSKILAVIEALYDHKWVVWMDADTLIMNMGIPLEDFIDETYMKNSFLIGQDFNVPNSGVFFIKNSAQSFDFLNDVYSHAELACHPWWENAAIIQELSNQKYKNFAKIVPQRLFNSYPEETHDPTLISAYKKGDFLIHFASVRDLDDLSSLFNKYAKEVVYEKDLLTLIHFLGIYGFDPRPRHCPNLEGYMTESQRKQFVERLNQYPHVKRILEIGLNAGHSADNFFRTCKNLEEFVSFDINLHPYTKPAIEYFQRTYKRKFTFVEGDSLVTVPHYAETHSSKFDLIYIDGNHTLKHCYRDIVNCRKLAHKNTVLWIDDYAPPIKAAIDELHKKGVITIEKIHYSDNVLGARIWVEARYNID